MNEAELFIYSVLGFAVGSFINAGYIMQIFFILRMENANGMQRLAFYTVQAAVALSCGVATVLVLVLIIVKDGWSVLRIGVFCFWLVVSMGISVFGYSRIAARLNPLLKRLE